MGHRHHVARPVRIQPPVTPVTGVELEGSRPLRHRATSAPDLLHGLLARTERTAPGTSSGRQQAPSIGSPTPASAVSAEHQAAHFRVESGGHLAGHQDLALLVKGERRHVILVA
eukprot:478999-Rhodomonas_salina.3